MAIIEHRVPLDEPGTGSHSEAAAHWATARTAKNATQLTPFPIAAPLWDSLAMPSTGFIGHCCGWDAGIGLASPPPAPRRDCARWSKALQLLSRTSPASLIAQVNRRHLTLVPLLQGCVDDFLDVSFRALIYTALTTVPLGHPRCRKSLAA